MSTKQIVDTYIQFFEDRNHKRIGNTSLVPENDPTTLFTSSGMQPLVPYLLGEQHPQGTRLVNIQNCFRAQDIEEIGDNRHTTFFRMLGNWSLGEYFKEDQLLWIFEFLTDRKNGLGLKIHKLVVTVFRGADNFKVRTQQGKEFEDLGVDVESTIKWQSIFKEQGQSEIVVDMTDSNTSSLEISAGKIFQYGVDKNWWSRSGPPEKMPIGEPGGPDSEVFYDFGKELKLHESSPYINQLCHPNCDCGRFMEISNSVFMQYKKIDNSTFEELPNRNVDFGGGLERLLSAIENQQDVFQTSLLAPIISSIERITGKEYQKYSKEMRIIADHLISATFISANNIKPSNKEQGYLLRRLIRRAFDNINTIRNVENMNIPTRKIIETIIDQYKDTDPNLEKDSQLIINTVLEELNNYRSTLTRAQRFIKGKYKIGDELMGTTEISAEDAFILYTTHGLSPTQIKSLGYEFNEQEFAEKMKEHQKTSRASIEKKFHGGLADHQEKTIMGHTATHLLHQALRDVLGNHVHQTGSNITTERIRFDFNYDQKLIDEQIQRVEAIVNEKIKENLPVHFEMIPTQKAKEMGAIGLFEETYGDMSKIYFIGGSSEERNASYSVEFCGGPHVDSTGNLKQFKIIKQENIGNKQRRIYSVVG